jgi:3-phytase
MAASQGGAVAVYRLDGTRVQSITGVDRPNNIDVTYGVKLGGRTIDLAVATERNRNALRLFEIARDGSGLRNLASIPVFEAPMGIGLYRCKRDGALYAIVSRKSGPSGSYLWQYRIEDDGAGRPRGVKVREFGAFSGTKEIEAIAVDEELGFVYYSDEGAGIRKYHADPGHREAAKELTLFATSGWKGDREGIAIYRAPKGSGGKGYIVATDQLRGNSEFHVFAREGTAANPHDHSRELGVFRVGSDTTDGIEICPAPLGREFPKGLFLAMNDNRRNFILVDWRAIASALGLLRN